MHKYNAKRTTTADGITHDSKREANRWQQLKLLERAGQISHLERQVEIPFEVKGKPVFKYVADFKYREAGQSIIEDAKGVRTAVYKLKKKIIEAAYYPIQIREV